MLELQSETRFIVDDVFVQYCIRLADKPLMITFSSVVPAGHVLATKDAEAGSLAWGFDFFKQMEHNPDLLGIQQFFSL